MKCRFSRSPGLAIFVWLACCAWSASTHGQSQITLKDYTAKSGVNFEHRDGSSGRHYLVEVVAAGMASFDYDSDGRQDLLFLNGAALPGSDYDQPPCNATFRNQGGFAFHDVTQRCGLADIGFGLGVTVGDYDNDGFPDVYVSNFGPNALYRNNGDGTYVKVAEQTVLECGDKAGGGCCMLDMDADGDLDIYAASYMNFDFNIPPSEFRGRIVYGGPLLYEKATDNLLANHGDGQFQDVSRQAGIEAVAEWGMGTVCFDFDQDGDTDIFVANDSTKNTLWTNDGGGSFTDTALLMGVAYDHRGDPQGSMGADVADFDGDLWLDLFQTAYTKQLATLYQNMEGFFFQDATLATGAGVGTLYLVNWGTGFVDFDNDGDKDIFIANGHIHDNMDDLDDTVSYKLTNQVLENRNGKKFVDISANCGDGLLPRESSRGIAIDDFDCDGRPDVVVLNSRTFPTVLRNESPQNGHWIELNFVGLRSNRDAIGSQVLLTADGRNQRLEVHSGRGYQSHFGSTLHFGVGQAQTIDRLEIHWHGQETQVIEDLDCDAVYVIREGKRPVRIEVPQ